MTDRQAQSRRPARSPARVRLVLATGAAIAWALFAGPARVSAQESKAPPPQREQLTIETDGAIKPWIGDLDGMVERRLVRVLVVHSKTFYFLDRGVQRGATYDVFRLFEDDLNSRLA